VIFTAKVEAGANVVVFGLGGIGLNVIQAAKMVGADKIIGVDINPGREAMARKFGMTHFVNPKEVENVVDAIVQLTDGGADYSFECIGNVTTMRQALECCHKGWGQSIIIGVAEAGKEIATRPFQLVTGRVWKGSAFGGARGRTDVPKIVDWYMENKINIDDLITHHLPLERINEGFDLMKSGESIRSVVVFSASRTSCRMPACSRGRAPRGNRSRSSARKWTSTAARWTGTARQWTPSARTWNAPPWARSRTRRRCTRSNAA
jgi:S-(hydroxymethyl)glutathione dehydrogenase/alcohol dehydrogenase